MHNILIKNAKKYYNEKQNRAYVSELITSLSSLIYPFIYSMSIGWVTNERTAIAMTKKLRNRVKTNIQLYTEFESYVDNLLIIDYSNEKSNWYKFWLLINRIVQEQYKLNTCELKWLLNYNRSNGSKRILPIEPSTAVAVHVLVLIQTLKQAKKEFYTKSFLLQDQITYVNEI